VHGNREKGCQLSGGKVTFRDVHMHTFHSQTVDANTDGILIKTIGDIHDNFRKLCQ
jgi:hypothetical protein